MTKRKWFWLICLSPLIGLEIYDGVQGAITGLAMKKHCEAEAGLTLYPNVKYEMGIKGYCNQRYERGCPNKTEMTRSFVPVWGAVSTPQRIYIMSKPEEEMLEVFKGGALVREVYRYSTDEGEPLGEYIFFSPNGVLHSLTGPLMYRLTNSKKFWDTVDRGCRDFKSPSPNIGSSLYRSKE